MCSWNSETLLVRGPGFLKFKDQLKPFGVDVTEEDIEKLSTKLRDELGGWVFHRKVDFSSPTPHIDCESSVPSVMDEWIKRNGK